jgi:hypothetical protein
MQRLEVAVTIRASADKVWQMITDIRTWPEWGPSVTGVRCQDRFIRSGSTGSVRTIFGLWLPFAIMDVVDKTYWSWRVCGIHATGHRVESLSQNRCRLVFDMSVLAAPYWGVCAIALRRIRHLAENP